MIDWSSLAEQVRVERARRGIDQKDAAKEMGISPSSLCRLEKAKVVSASSFMAACGWLGCKAETIMKTERE